MLKKNLLLLSLGFMIAGQASAYYPYCYNDGYCYRRSKFDRSVDRAILYVAGSVTALVIATYLWNRESNGSAICRVNNLYSNLSNQARLHRHSLVSFAQNADISVNDREQLFRARFMMTNRYKSWIKPWDWSSGMQRAYEKIRVATVLGAYLPLVLNVEALTGEDMSKFARETFAVMSKYPCMLCVESLNEDIVYVRNIINGAACSANAELIPLLQQILSVLERARNLLRCEKEYLDEVRTKTTHNNQDTQIFLAAFSRR